MNVNLLDLGGWRPMFDPIEKLINIGGFPLGDDLNGAVGQVFDIAGEAKLICLNLSVVSKSDSLYVALDN